MPGDTYTPPSHRKDTTVLDDGHVLEFQKARDDLRPYSVVAAERDAQAAYEQQTPERIERIRTPEEYAEWQLSQVLKARHDRMAA